jgi:cellobiose-specific phosphotransferase system component IIB
MFAQKKQQCFQIKDLKAFIDIYPSTTLRLHNQSPSLVILGPRLSYDHMDGQSARQRYILLALPTRH